MDCKSLSSTCPHKHSVMNLVLKNILLIQNTKLAFTENRIQYIQVSIMTTKDIIFSIH